MAQVVPFSVINWSPFRLTKTALGSNVFPTRVGVDRQGRDCPNR